MIRRVQVKDLPRLMKLHADSGFDWPFPDLTDAITAQVVVDDNDSPVMMLGARPMAEAFAIFDPTWGNAGMKMAALSSLYSSAEAEVRRAGFREFVAWLPPKIAGKFGVRLQEHFGWVENRWRCWVGFARER